MLVLVKQGLKTAVMTLAFFYICRHESYFLKEKPAGDLFVSSFVRSYTFRKGSIQTGVMMASDNERLTFQYRFKFADGSAKHFLLRLDPISLSLTREPKPAYPEWTRLNYHQCPNCPLKPETTPYCPVAVNLMDVVDTFKDVLSHERAEVEIVAPDRTYSAHTALQNAIGSLIGMIMATSDCPVLDKLRPMVRTHLPFATAEETMYRVISMYLLGQFFRYRRGLVPDWELKNLITTYEGAQTVNKAFVERLASLDIQDSSMNAVVILDCFAATTNFSIMSDSLNEIEQLFSAYLKKEDTTGEKENPCRG